MAHELEVFEDGTAAFFAARTPGWHKLGTVTADSLTADEALKTAHLDWTVEKTDAPVAAPSNDGELLIADKYLTYRKHPVTGESNVLGVVGKNYTPVQNVEAFAWLDALTDESGAHFDTAGSLAGGKRVFVSMKFPEQIMLGGHDATDLYLLAWNSHDGTGAFHTVVSPVRVVCQNTLSAAIGRAKASFSIRHDRQATTKVQQARETMGLTFKYAEAFQQEAEKMMAAQMTKDEFARMVEDLVPEFTGMTDRAKANVNITRSEIINVWDSPLQDNIRGTRWAAYNAVVDWADFTKKVKGQDPEMARARRVVMDLAGTDRSVQPLSIKRKSWRLLAA
jgi:phage/plasmid-like protein (TIGR03299 family)